MSKYLFQTAIVRVMSCIASGQTLTNVIYQHNGFYNDPNDPNIPNYYYYTISAEGQVTIHHGVEGQVFQFEAVRWDPNDPNGPYVGPGDINLITAGVGAGTVQVSVLPNINEGAYGAQNIRWMTLTATDVTSSIQALSISGTLGTYVLTENSVDSIDGPFSVADVGRPLHVPNGLFDTLTITGSGSHFGNIQIGRFESPASLAITGSMLGLIELGNEY